MKFLSKVCIPFVASCLLVGALTGGEREVGKQASKQQTASWVGRIDGIVDSNVSARLCYGPLPPNAEFFKALAQSQIRTVVSVDGKRPDVETAKRFGLRYIHIPLNYDSVTESQKLALGSVLREVEGKIYFHCHHGHHRAPVALSIACLANGQMNVAQAKAILRKAGTSTDYKGLWESVEDTRLVTDWSSAPQLVATAKVSDITESMTSLEETFSTLQEPELTSSKRSELLLVLEEHYKELKRQRDWPTAFKERIGKSVKSVSQIRAQWKGDADYFADGISKLKSDCKSCHQSFRDNGMLDTLLSSPNH